MIDSSRDKLKEDVLSFKQKGRVALLRDFNARVGKTVDMLLVCLGKRLLMPVGTD